jgi:cardiolipin synthase
MIIANLVTFLRVLAAPLIMYLVLEEYWGWAFAIFIGASITDMLDGFLARHYHSTSQFGRYFDPIADKLLLSTTFAALTITGKIPVWLFMLLFIRDLIILAGAWLLYRANQQRAIRPLMWGKVNTVLQIALVILTLAHMVWPTKATITAIVGLALLTAIFGVLSLIAYIFHWWKTWQNKDSATR